jgi:hypothetical protein
MTLKRAKELASVPAGFLLQTQRSQSAKSPHSHRLSVIGHRGGIKTAQRGCEYFSAIGKLGGKTRTGKKSWNAMRVPSQISNGAK